MKVLIIGATGGAGREIAREALLQHLEVRTLVRSTADKRQLPSGVDIVEGDALDPVATEKALSGCEGAISALGPKLSPFLEVTLLSCAKHVLIDAMQRQSVRRLVCITGMGAGDSRGHGGFFYDRIFQPLLLASIYRDKVRQEAQIRASDLDWTIVRQTVLTNGSATGAIRAMTDLTGFHGGSIAREDVARFIVDKFCSRRWVGQTPLITAEKDG